MVDCLECCLFGQRPSKAFSQVKSPSVSEARIALEVQRVPRGLAVAGRETLAAEGFSGCGEGGLESFRSWGAALSQVLAAAAASA